MLDRWEAVLTGLESDPSTVADQVDWVAKQRLVDGYADRHDLEPGSARLKAIDLQYHDLRADRCLALRAGLDTMVSPDEVVAAMTEPPHDDPRLLPRQVPRRSTPTTSSRRTGTRWCSTSGATRSGGCR